MNLMKIVMKNMRQRALATWLTGTSVALGVALAVAIVLIKQGVQQRFEQGTLGYEMVVGAKGSPLQLVLNTVYNLDISPGNISWKLFEQLRADPRVKLAVPFSVGDNFHGFRIVGTTDAFFKEFEFEPGHRPELAAGRIFNFSEAALKGAFQEAEQRAKEREAKERGEEVKPAPAPEDASVNRPFEAVVGATVASETGLQIGQTFIAAHGVQPSAEAKEHTENPWTVVGILAPTRTAADRAIYINLDSFYHIEGHEIRQPTAPAKAEEKDNDPDPGQVSSIVLKLRSPIHALTLYREINDREDAMAAFPAAEIRKLFDIVGNIDRLLLAQAILVLIVAGVAIAVSIYNSMSERRREIAILRALGARRATIFSIVLLEAMTICVVGAAAGLLGGHLVVAAANGALYRASGFVIPAFHMQALEWYILTVAVILGAVSGLGPAWGAYRTDVAKNLAPTS
ncbi:MAG TPA: FtsX-like permease family protein [Verrucomicrobiae bacterium]|nr:FtsX-like permease family protein [Verrucomicrobiae bacterium]